MRARSVRALSISAACLLALGAAAGCGGSDSGSQLTAEEYSSKLNAICEEFNAAQKEIGEPQSIEDISEFGTEVGNAFDEAIAAAGALVPPDELAEPAEEFIALGEEQRALLEDLVQAAEDGDEERLSAVSDEGSELDAKSDELADELGAPACSE